MVQIKARGCQSGVRVPLLVPGPVLGGTLGGRGQRCHLPGAGPGRDESSGAPLPEGEACREQRPPPPTYPVSFSSLQKGATACPCPCTWEEAAALHPRLPVQRPAARYPFPPPAQPFCRQGYLN